MYREKMTKESLLYEQAYFFFFFFFRNTRNKTRLLHGIDADSFKIYIMYRAPVLARGTCIGIMRTERQRIKT